MLSIPRVVIAAPASGHGKTSVATGMLDAFRRRGRVVSPHKVGPDYIDPSYHALAAGRPGRNLDPWLVGEEQIAPLFVHGATTPTLADLAIVEGVMGLHDGAVGHGTFASTAHVAALLQAPVILVVDATGAGRSLAALVHGFATWDPSVRIGGVVVNRVGSDRHREIVVEAVESTGVPVLGVIPRQDSLAVPSRHLGLVPATERTDAARATVAELGRIVAASVDLDAVERLARTAPTLDASAPPALAAADQRPAVRIGVAGGSAFTFGYAEQAELLAAAGAEVVTWDPVHDRALPEDVDGLVIGGGFPEVYAAALADNHPLRAEVGRFAVAGGPIAAECAGLLYLGRSLDGQPMCDVLPMTAVMTPTLRLGYRSAVAPADSVLAVAGTRVCGHEFHRTRITPDAGATPAWRWGEHADGFVQGGIHASYLHLNWVGHPALAQRFVAACRPGQRVPA